MSGQALPALVELGSRELASYGLALVLAGLALTPVCVALARRFTPKAQVFFARWRFLHALLVALVLMGGGSLAALLLTAVPATALSENLRDLLAMGIALGLCGVLILVFAARLDPDGIRSLGLRARGSLRAAVVGVACFLLLLPGLFGLTLLWPYVLESLGREFAQQEIAQKLQTLQGSELWLAGVLVIGVHPFLEELCFRGFLQPLLVQNLGDRGGVFLASLVFAVLHGDSAFLPILGLALLLGSLQLRTQRLLAPFAVHALFNALTFTVLTSSQLP